MAELAGPASISRFRLNQGMGGGAFDAEDHKDAGSGGGEAGEAT
jgi:hypothetical protein